MKNKNAKSVQTATVIQGNKEGVILTIPQPSEMDTMIGRFSHLSASEKITLGGMITNSAKESLRLELTTLQGQVEKVRAILGENVTQTPKNPITAPSGAPSVIKAGSNSEKLLTVIRANPNKGMTEIAQLAGIQFIANLLKKLTESGVIIKNEETKTYTVKG